MNRTDPKPAASIRYSVQISTLDAKDLPASLATASQAGLDGIELFWQHCLDHQPKKLRRQLDAHGVEVSAIYVPMAFYQQDLAAFAALCASIRSIGCDTVNISGGFPLGHTRGDEHRVVAELANRIGHEASQHGLISVLHTHAKQTLARVESIDAVISAGLDTWQVGLCLDPWEWVKAGGNSLEALRRYRPLIRYLHINNGTRRGTPTPTLFEGCVPMEELSTELFRTDYHGWITIDSGNPSEPIAYLAAAKRGLESLRTEVSAAAENPTGADRGVNHPPSRPTQALP